MRVNVIRARDPRDPPQLPVVDRSPEAVAAHLEDAAHFTGGLADGIARPRTEGEVAALVMSASQVLPIGAQSSVTGGATPAGGLLLSTERFATIELMPGERVRVGAGVPLERLQSEMRGSGLWYPPAPTFMGAFAGGVVATNAAGAATFKYGTTRAWVDRLTVVLPCGHVLDVDRGATSANGREGFRIQCGHGERSVQPGSYVMPDVPKCSAGYFAQPAMDLIDLFIGAEGTLGVITEVIFRVRPLPGSSIFALVPVPDEARGLRLTRELREASRLTWSSGDPHGIDVAAIEHLDRRCLQILREDGIERQHSVTVPADAAMLLLIQLELARETTPETAYDEIAQALSSAAADSALARFCQVLGRHEVLDATEVALPGDLRRVRQFLAVREAAPSGVNRRVGDVKRTIDSRVEKTAADMIVPFDRFAEMMAVYRDGYSRRGLDYAIWGHISDGNVHPNVIPRSFADVIAGREAILEFGRQVVELGGSPLAEHGVGRSPLKQQLLRQLYGDKGIEEMRALKRAIDPDWKLAPGVIFPA